MSVDESKDLDNMVSCRLFHLEVLRTGFTSTVLTDVRKTFRLQ